MDQIVLELDGVRNGSFRPHDLMQLFSSTLTFSTTGLEEGHYEGLDLTVPAADGTVDDGAAALRWMEIRELTFPESHSLVDAIPSQDIPPPEVGYELSGERGVVAGTAEFA